MRLDVLCHLPGVGWFRRASEDVDQHGDVDHQQENEPDPLAQLRRLDECADPGDQRKDAADDYDQYPHERKCGGPIGYIHCAICIQRLRRCHEVQDCPNDAKNETDEIEVARGGSFHAFS